MLKSHGGYFNLCPRQTRCGACKTGMFGTDQHACLSFCAGRSVDTKDVWYSLLPCGSLNAFVFQGSFLRTGKTTSNPSVSRADAFLPDDDITVDVPCLRDGVCDLLEL